MKKLNTQKLINELNKNVELISGNETVKQDHLKQEEENLKKQKKYKKDQLSTWGSIKSGFKGINNSLKIDNNNKITWGGIGNNMKDAIQDWHKKTLKMNNLLGKTFRISNNLIKNTTGKLLDGMKTTFSKIMSDTREVLGPVAEVFDMAKGILIGAFGFMKGMYTSIFGTRVKPEDKLRNRFLQQIVGFFTKQEKKSAREGKPKSKISKIIQTVLFSVGIVLGAAAAIILAPFRVLIIALKKTTKLAKNIFGNSSKIFKPFKFFFDKIKSLGKGLSNFFKPVKKFFNRIKSFGKTFKSLGKFLKPLVAGFKIGFKVLGWPLTTLLSIIDFIKGFWGAFKEGKSITESLKVGIFSALMGFISPLIDLFSFVFEGLSSLFGIKLTETSEYIKTIFSSFFTALLSPINTFKNIINYISNIWDILGGFEGITTSIKEFFVSTFTNTFEFIKTTFTNIFTGITDFFVLTFTNTFEFIKNTFTNIFTGITDFFGLNIQTIKDNFINIFTISLNTFKFYLDKVKDIIQWAGDKLKNITNFFGKKYKSTKDFLSKGKENIKSFFTRKKPTPTPKIYKIPQTNNIKEIELKKQDSIKFYKIKQQETQDTKQQETQQLQTKQLQETQNIIKSITQTQNIINQQSQTQNTKQIPDEVDGSFVSLELLYE